MNGDQEIRKNKIKEEELLNQGEKNQHEHEGWEKRVSKKLQTKDIKKMEGKSSKELFYKTNMSWKIHNCIQNKYGFRQA